MSHTRKPKSDPDFVRSLGWVANGCSDQAFFAFDPWSGLLRSRQLSAHSEPAFGAAYLDRAAPRLATAKFLVVALALGPFIEPDPGSN